MKTAETEKNGKTEKQGAKTEALLKRMTPPWRMAGRGAGETVLLALSGGADSVALLALLAGRAELLAVHVHHGIRGAEADRDAAFCEQLTAALGVPLVVLRVDVPALAAQSGESLEAVAREARYEAIAALMRPPCLTTS